MRRVSYFFVFVYEGQGRGGVLRWDGVWERKSANDLVPVFSFGENDVS